MVAILEVQESPSGTAQNAAENKAQLKTFFWGFSRNLTPHGEFYKYCSLLFLFFKLECLEKVNITIGVQLTNQQSCQSCGFLVDWME